MTLVHNSHGNYELGDEKLDTINTTTSQLIRSDAGLMKGLINPKNDSPQLTGLK